MAVSDGINIGHPCCSVQDCQNPLVKNTALYCYEHENHANLCAVTICNSLKESGFLTCSNPEHRKMETNYKQKGTSLKKLKERLQAIEDRESIDSLSQEVHHNDDDITSAIDLLSSQVPNSSQATEESSIKLFAHFGRRTHNEQSIVWPCGIIVSRTTMFSSEALNAVKVSIVFNIISKLLTINCL